MESNYSGLKPPYKRGALLCKRSESLCQTNMELREGEVFASFLVSTIEVLSVLFTDQPVGKVTFPFY